MPSSLREVPIWPPVAISLVAMASIQGGASLAKSLFPLMGAPGVTAPRLALGTLILIAFFKSWRLRFTKEQRLPLLFYGVSLGGMSYLLYPSVQTVLLGIAVALELTGPLAMALFSSRRPVDFVWIVLAVLGLWFLPLLGQDVSHVDLIGCTLALGAGACWAIYILGGQHAGVEHGPATVVIGSLIVMLISMPIGAFRAGEVLWYWSVIPLGLVVAILSTAPPYSLEMIALTRLSTRTFGMPMSIEPTLAAISEMILLGETLAPIQLLAPDTIIIVSMGSILTVRKESRIRELDINWIYIPARLYITMQNFSLLSLYIVLIHRIM